MTIRKRLCLISVAAIAALCLNVTELCAESLTPSLVQVTIKDEHGNEKHGASQGNRVDSTFLPTFGIVPLAGRNFTAREDTLNAPRTALLSYGFWMSRYAGDRGIVGSHFGFF